MQVLPAVRKRDRSAPALADRYRRVRAETLRFVEPLSAEDMMVQSSADASPGKWHLAHTAWFFETFVLTPYARDYTAFHPDFHWLFNSYYTSLGEMPAKNLRSSFSRPGLETILAYRAHVDAAVSRLLLSVPDEAAEDVLRRVVLGLEHEQQHLELLATDLKHALFTNPLHPAYRESLRTLDGGRTSRLEFTGFAGGLTEVGVTPPPEDAYAFAFDNETPRHTVYLAPYSLANRLTTVGEYLEFLEDDGYARPELWLSEGWSTMRREGWQAPLYWRRTVEDGWQVFTLEGFVPAGDLLATPVCHVSLFEADAYARWKGCRLPTEFEWEHAAANTTADGANMLENSNLHPVASRDEGMTQMFGDAWEWTSSGYAGYPGYKPLPGALGEYNGKFMSSQVILRGGSCVTPAEHIRASYRNFFPPATRWQFSGLRLARDGAR